MIRKLENIRKPGECFGSWRGFVDFLKVFWRPRRFC